MQEELLSEFAGVTKTEWLDKIVTDLRGKAYAELRWQKEGIQGEPVYTKEDLDKITGYQALQNNTDSPDAEVLGARYWVNYQLIAVDDEKIANQEALDALNLGADGLLFQISKTPDFAKLLQDIQPEFCAVSFETTQEIPGFLSAYINHLESKDRALDKISGYISSPGAISKEEIRKTFRLKGFKTNNIKLPNQLESVNAVTELSLLLRLASERISELVEFEMSSEEICPTLQFQLRLGKDYFIEIAKVRAIKLLVQTLMEGFGQSIKASDVNVLSASSNWQESAEDKYNHLLSATTGAMSAIVGGCNALLIRPFDTTFDSQTSLASRNARNMSSILKDEAYLNKVIDPSAGSYFIENVTDQLINSAWSLFLELEKLEDPEQLSVDTIDSLQTKSLAE